MTEAGSWSDDRQWYWNGKEWIPANQAPTPPPPSTFPASAQTIDRGIGRNVSLFAPNPKGKMFEFHVDPTLPFTSDLTAQEFWLTIDKGYRPLGLVVGNSVYSIGHIRGLLGNWKAQFRGDVMEFSQLLYDARKIAMWRMQEEARLLGADGIIGVELEIKELHHVLGRAGEFIEVVSVGTAVKLVDGERARTQDKLAVVLSVNDQPPVVIQGPPAVADVVGKP
jgi:uncharacterized protein YbjQ (UPF0145 family)